MRLLILLPLLAILIGCGPSQSRAAFESDHPYAKPASEIHSPETGLTVVQYLDHVPSIGFDGSGYRLVPTQYTMVYNRDGSVYARERVEVGFGSVLP